jgi:FAD/FMN-containing dehydrogenase
MFPLTDYDDFVSSAVVAPKDTDETQLIVRWANKHKIPIYPFSIGRNLGYGGSARKILNNGI